MICKTAKFGLFPASFSTFGRHRTGLSLFFDDRQAHYFESWLPIARFIALESDRFFCYLCLQDQKPYRLAER